MSEGMILLNPVGASVSQGNPGSPSQITGLILALSRTIDVDLRHVLESRRLLLADFICEILASYCSRKRLPG